MSNANCVIEEKSRDLVYVWIGVNLTLIIVNPILNT